jgi:hypothetical protein
MFGGVIMSGGFKTAAKSLIRIIGVSVEISIGSSLGINKPSAKKINLNFI